VIDGHKTFHELIERDAILKHDPRNPKMIVLHGIGQQNGPQFFQVVSHGLASGFNEIPAQG
jgi:hypothetical protein